MRIYKNQDNLNIEKYESKELFESLTGSTLDRPCNYEEFGMLPKEYQDLFSQETGSDDWIALYSNSDYQTYLVFEVADGLFAAELERE